MTEQLTQSDNQSMHDADLAERIRRSVRLTRAGERDPNTPLRDWLISWLDTQREDKPLVQILRLPRNDGLLEILQSEGPYVGAPLGFTATLRATRAVQLVVGENHYTISGAHEKAIVEGGIRRLKKIYKDLAAGEEITLPARYALLALQTHAASAWPEDLRDGSNAVPQEDLVEEIGWSTTEFVGGEILQSAPPKKPRGRPRKDAV